MRSWHEEEGETRTEREGERGERGRAVYSSPTKLLNKGSGTKAHISKRKKNLIF